MPMRPNLKKYAIVIGTKMHSQTAEPSGALLGLAVETDDRLREQDYGIYEGVDRGDERFLANKRQFCVDYPQGESMFRVAHRVYNAIEAAKAEYPDKNVLFVCHGGVCRVIRTYFEPMTNEEYFGYSPDNAFLAEYEL